MDNVIVNRIYWQCWSWCYERYQQLENKAILTCATGTKWTSDTSVFSVFRHYVRRQFGVSVVSYQKTTTYFSVYRSAKSKKTPFFKHISLSLWWVSAKTTASVLIVNFKAEIQKVTFLSLVYTLVWRSKSYQYSNRFISVLEVEKQARFPVLIKFFEFCDLKHQN